MLIVCLCAEWCRTCEGFRADFDRYAAQAPQHAMRWLDVEDEADLVGDLEIETFPTLLVVDDAQPLFFGPILPTREHLARIAARPGGMKITDVDVIELAARLAAQHEARRA